MTIKRLLLHCIFTVREPCLEAENTSGTWNVKLFSVASMNNDRTVIMQENLCRKTIIQTPDISF